MVLFIEIFPEAMGWHFAFTRVLFLVVIAISILVVPLLSVIWVARETAGQCNVLTIVNSTDSVVFAVPIPSIDVYFPLSRG